MKIKLGVLILSIFSSTTFASEITITGWYRLNARDTSDRAAEVCFKLRPSPEKLTSFRVRVDYKTPNEGIYYGHIGPEGMACQVVSTFYGKVEVSIPTLEMDKKQESFL